MARTTHTHTHTHTQDDSHRARRRNPPTHRARARASHTSPSPLTSSRLAGRTSTRATHTPADVSPNLCVRGSAVVCVWEGARCSSRGASSLEEASRQTGRQRRWKQLHARAPLPRPASSICSPTHGGGGSAVPGREVWGSACIGGGVWEGIRGRPWPWDAGGTHSFSRGKRQEAGGGRGGQAEENAAEPEKARSRGDRSGTAVGMEGLGWYGVCLFLL
jgi:hypothetical protein